MNRVEEIVNYAVELRKFLRTNNPYKIAEYYGIKVNEHIEITDI